MNSELTHRLLKRFPIPYQDYDSPMTHTCMCWGFDHGDGWFEIIWQLSLAIEEELGYSWPRERWYLVKKFFFRFWNRFIYVLSPIREDIHLLQVFLAWVRKGPYARYLAKLRVNRDADVVKRQQVQASLDALNERLGDNRAAKVALSEAVKLYKLERNYLIRRAETTENLAGIGLSVETASHDIMAIMRRGLGTLDSLIAETQKPGLFSKDFVNQELISLRGMFSFVESQLKDLQLLFKSTKQRRKDVRVREILEKVHHLFEASLRKEDVSFQIVEQGQPLIAKTTDAVLLQLFLNLFDNSIYWLNSKSAGKRQIEVLLDGDEGELIFADNGPGVLSEDVAYIFEPFYSGKGEDGRGLGLYIARQLLERHDYSIELADTARRKLLPGANFVVSFVSKEA